MESLYRKYRPQTFAGVVGQQHVVNTLEHAVLEGRLNHAYLFCGPRGTGKTTMARLLAKALLCEEGAGHLPDGTCEQCALIAAGDHPDVYELDAASRTGVESVREEIISRVNYAPVRGAFKVYIIDEVHMLSVQAFNALLKTLEEPPGHVVFILCTTDPQKIPDTILSRVQRFDFRPIGDADVLDHLTYICEQEGFTYEDEALEIVVRNAHGGMRDALSTLEQLSVFGGGVIDVASARDLLGAVSGETLDNVMRALAARDVAGLFAQVANLVDSGNDLLQFTRELAAHVRDVYVVAVVGADPSVLPAGSNAEKLQIEAAQFGSVDRLSRVLALLGDVMREMSTAPNQRLVLEIAFTRIARPEEDLTLESLAERVAALEQGAPRVQAPMAVAPVSAPQATQTAQPQPASQAASQTAPQQTSGTANRSVSQPASERQMGQRREETAQPARQAPQSRQPEVRPMQQPQHQVESAQRPAPAPQPAPAQRPAPAPQPQPERRPAPRQVEPRRQQPAPQPQSREEQRPAKPVVAGTSAVTDPGTLQRMWRQAVTRVMEQAPSRGSLLTSATALSDNGEKLVVGLPKGSTFALKMLDQPNIRAIVEGPIKEVFGERQIVFQEGTGSGRQIPEHARAAMRQRNAAPAQPASAPQSAPQPQPAPQPQSANQPQPAPQTQPASQPQTAPQTRSQPTPQPAPRESYPMPWEEPAQPDVRNDMPPVEAYDDYVPYDEVAGSYDQVPYSEPAPDPAPQPQPAPEPQPAPQQQVVSQPALEPQPEPEQTPDSIPNDVPDDLPPELVTILENAFEVFGASTRVDKKS